MFIFLNQNNIYVFKHFQILKKKIFKKIFFSFNSFFFNFFYFNFFFFKKRLLLIKFFKRMDAYFFIKIFKKYTYHRNLNKIKKKIFLKKWFKFFFSKIIIKKFNFLKKIFYKNVQKILKKKVNIVKYTLFFKNFLKYKNINFFFFLQFNLTNIIKYSYFFFHSFFLKKYITHLGIYINGCLHKNMNYLLSYNNNYNVQFI